MILTSLLGAFASVIGVYILYRQVKQRTTKSYRWSPWSRFLDFQWRKGRIDNITNRYVLVTGCDSGFGAAITKHLDNLGVRVFACCLTEKGQREIKSACSSRVETLSLDVTDRQAIMRAVTIVKKRLSSEKGLWGVVNNAGVQMLHAPIELHTHDDIDKTMAVNLMGVINVTRAFLPLLRKSHGRVVNISSPCGFITWPCRFAYCVTKHGVESFTSCIRRELYHVGVKASSIQPGSFKTSIVTPEGMTAQLQNAYDNADDEIRQFYGQKIFKACTDHYDAIPPTQNPDLSAVTDATEHALFAIHPRRSYLAGKDANGWMYPLSLLPVWIVDWHLAMTKPQLA